MRKPLLLSLLFSVLITAGSKAQYVDIPDSTLRSFLQFNYQACMNAQGQLDTTCNGILSVDSLMLRPGAGVSGCVTDFTGLQYFKSLRKLDIANNFCLQTFPYISTLKELRASYCSSIKLSLLPNGLKLFSTALFSSPSSTDNQPPFVNDNNHFPDSLEFIDLRYCSSTSGFSLPPLPSRLKFLDISWTNVDSLPGLPSSLEYLDCSANRGITSLPALPAVLRYLNFSNTSAVTLPALPDSLRTLITLGVESLPPLPEKLNYMDVGVFMASSLPALPVGLDTLFLMNGGNLTSLGRLPDSLRYFVCTYTAITAIENFPDKLDYVYLGYNNNLTTLPRFPASLLSLTSTNNPLTNIASIETATSLAYLTISQSQLTTLPPLPESVRVLTCENNAILSTLPASAGRVDRIICRNNALTSLPALTSRVKELDCSVNQLTTLPPLPDSLAVLTCHYNRISEIPALPASLGLLVTIGNPITCLPSLQQFSNSLLYVYVDSTKVHCVSNTLNRGAIIHSTGPYYYDPNHSIPFWITGSDLPLCNPTNNISSCPSFPVISGNIFYDLNSNGIQDNGEQYKDGAKIDLDNSTTNVFSNRNGYFEVATEGTGNSSITVEPILFYNAIPSTAAYNFTSYDTIVSKSYALQPNQVKDSVTINLIPLSWAARPGFSYPFLIRYENIGTTVLNTVITMQYDNTKLVYDSSNAIVINNGTSLTHVANNFSPGETKNIIAYFRLKPTAALGDSLTTVANIAAGSQNNNSSLNAIIGGAFDPNDKQATPQLTPSQVANGDYIDYTIRFQNTGTDTAFTVVISDTLNDDLQVNTLQMTATSHNCKTTVKDNIVYFEFLNILLPDSNVNEMKSHGFVSFKIKPKTTVAVNTAIPNSAAIYFDYNAPVITNIASTLIKDFTVIPLKLISFSAVPQNDNTTSLFWNTAHEINTKHFVIERSNNGMHFIAVTNVIAKGRANNNYTASVADANTGIIFYRLKMVDNDGRHSWSPVIKIDKRKNAAGFSILTNPVKEILVINSTDRSVNNTQATIINMQGAVVKTFILKEGSQTIDIKGLPAGIYFLKTINGSNKIFISE